MPFSSRNVIDFGDVGRVVLRFPGLGFGRGFGEHRLVLLGKALVTRRVDPEDPGVGDVVAEGQVLLHLVELGADRHVDRVLLAVDDARAAGRCRPRRRPSASARRPSRRRTRPRAGCSARAASGPRDPRAVVIGSFELVICRSGRDQRSRPMMPMFVRSACSSLPMSPSR